MVLPKPNSPNKFYIYHIFIDTSEIYINSTKQLLRTEIDMSLNSGQGRVIEKATVIIEEPLAPGNIMACRHGNGQDWWVVVPKRVSGYFVLLEDGNGMPDITDFDIGPVFDYVSGQSSFSPNGKWFARVGYRGITQPTNLALYSFDRCSGVMDLKSHFEVVDTSYGGFTIFSPNSELLYFSLYSHVLQGDVNELGNGQLNFDTVASYDFYLHQFDWWLVYPRFYTAQNAPNGKINVSTVAQSNLLHSIENPNVRGISCNFIQRSVTLPHLNQGTPPNMPNYRLGAMPGNPCDSVMVDVDEPFDTAYPITVTPNPAWDVITFSGLPEEAYTIYIYDELGRLMDQFNIDCGQKELTVKIHNLSAGIYYYSVPGRTTEGICGRFVKME